MENRQIRQIAFARFGPPAEVLALTAATPRELSAGELLLDVLFSPINPADLNVVEGTYGTRPALPAVAGGEASARVAAVGGGLGDRFAPGDHVILLKRIGCWRDRLVAGADDVCRIPAGLDPVQASMLSINPPTAWLLLHEFAGLRPGEWVAQNAANSGVGSALIQIARALGHRTVNFVRRGDLIPALEAIGADAVFLDDDDGLARARELTAADPPRLVLNAVGGASALRLMDLAAPGGTHVTYGAMSRESLKVPNKFLIFKDLRLRGLWVTRRMEALDRAAIQALFDRLCRFALESRLALPAGKIFPAERFAEALEHNAAEHRGGKVILAFAAGAKLSG